MTNHPNDIPTLEAANDLIAEAIDAAGDHAELLLAKTLFHLAVHSASVDALRQSLKASATDLD